VCPRPTGFSLQENLENQLYGEKQMTAQNYSVTGASPAYDYLWRQIN
jgi:hypothetical protein